MMWTRWKESEKGVTDRSAAMCAAERLSWKMMTGYAVWMERRCACRSCRLTAKSCNSFSESDVRYAMAARSAGAGAGGGSGSDGDGDVGVCLGIGGSGVSGTAGGPVDAGEERMEGCGKEKCGGGDTASLSW